jgi:hypothetical protein
MIGSFWSSGIAGRISNERAPAPWNWRVEAMGSAIIGQRCILSEEGVAILGGRRHHKLDRTGTIVGLTGDNYVVHWDGNAKETVRQKSFSKATCWVILD